MLNILLGISLTLNVLFVIGIVIYKKIKKFGFDKMLNTNFCTDKELEDMLNRL